MHESRKTLIAGAHVQGVWCNLHSYDNVQIQEENFILSLFVCTDYAHHCLAISSFHKYVFKKIQMISFDYLFPHTVHKNGVLISKANDQFSTLVEEWFILLHLQLSERMSSIECAVVHVYSQFIFSLIFQCKKKAADFLIGSVMMLLVLTAKCFSTIMFDFKGKSLS